MKIITLSLSLLFALVVMPRTARAADAVSVRAILITATQEKAPADKRLAPYEATLQRNLPESSFRFVVEGSAKITGRGRATISLDRGHRLELEGGERTAHGIKLNVQWMNGKTLIIDNSPLFRPGVPVVLGQRPGGDGEVHIVIVIAK
jgi:hypothetical protein